jgi:hypothetical protein
MTNSGKARDVAEGSTLIKTVLAGIMVGLFVLVKNRDSRNEPSEDIFLIAGTNLDFPAYRINNHTNKLRVVFVKC